MPNTSGDMTGMLYDPISNSWYPYDGSQVSEIQFADGVTRTVGELMESVVTPAGQSDNRSVVQFPPTETGAVVNTLASSIFGGDAGGGFNPANLDEGVATLRAFSAATYGSPDLGVIRRSSEALENEPTGVRPGTMERIVIPAWARNQRGSPI